MSQLIEVKVPDIGDYQDIPVIEVLIQPGDVIEKEQSLITLESDKATMDVPSSHAGVVKEVKVKVGDHISEGGLVLLLEAAEAAATPPVAAASSHATVVPATPVATTPAAAATATAAVTQTHTATPAATTNPTAHGELMGNSHASPSVRKFARELGVQVALVKGSGPKGRITQEDVQAFIKAAMSANAGGNSGGQATGLGNSALRTRAFYQGNLYP